MAPRNAKSRTNLHFRPRAALTLQHFVHNFKGLISRFHGDFEVGLNVVAHRIEGT